MDDDVVMDARLDADPALELGDSVAQLLIQRIQVAREDP